MGSAERSKKKVQLWKKAIVHFSLCFVMGFFTGFAPTGKDSFFSNHVADNKSLTSSTQHVNQSVTSVAHSSNVNRSLRAETPVPVPEPESSKRDDVDVVHETNVAAGRLLIVVTPTSTKDRFRGVFLRRLANTIRLVPQPLLWIVVESKSDSNEVSAILRKTGIMYRHLVTKENFTEAEAELNHQRNVALKHIEQHKLSGIVHFAGLSNVYDLDFFQQLRQIEVFGTWPMALLSANKRKVVIEGPVCDSSQVIGWHLRKMNNHTDDDTKPPIHISSFAFNSSILWDPERWGRPTSGQGTSQNSLKFVKQIVQEDESKLKGIPTEECSKIMLWRLKFPIGVVARDVVKTSSLFDVINQR
ncbi:putative beta-1,4-xylosyltransferase IRX9 [Hibiscus syriacus]|uniref:Glycosyltransferases n=1 Tax=Hibiscus syriacus TaxID=106335 RepID=A0A6A3BMR4_HIBSY|nr:beta-1,4-xylosyltransferase IRX9-like [Hibiscus syriacus]KAE8717337.1 putative beta-1,4-xylosyltransferase IRX9 [Hibiscus syriacus]